MVSLNLDSFMQIRICIQKQHITLQLEFIFMSDHNFYTYSLHTYSYFLYKNKIYAGDETQIKNK